MRSQSILHGKPQRGVTMIEILVTIVIVTIGLLGLAGLQARIQTAELESYQRVQAIVLLQDMVDRLAANRKEAVSYAVSVGTGSSAPSVAGNAGRDLLDWHNALLGASETQTVSGVTRNLGAMIGARGCISNPVTTMPYEFIVSVAWQGLTPTAIPPAGSSCGLNQYGTGANDAYRRVITQRVVFSCLQSDPVDGVTCLSSTP